MRVCKIYSICGLTVVMFLSFGINGHSRNIVSVIDVMLTNYFRIHNSRNTAVYFGQRPECALKNLVTVKNRTIKKVNSLI